ncbi:MAG: hypothetical protein KatS3mg114_0125 [Planctomycetaceae bacterium]|nr:MAG: hypothetical protein KatS3mg114_0125 [Planctomycetaceae bacterium]
MLAIIMRGAQIDLRRLQRVRDDLLALMLLAAAVWLILVLWSYDPRAEVTGLVHPAIPHVHNIGGTWGVVVAWHLIHTLGVVALALPPLLLLWDGHLFGVLGSRELFTQALGYTLMLTAAAVAAQWCPVALLPITPPEGNGGWWGAMLHAGMQHTLQPPGEIVLTVSVFLAGVILARELRFVRGLAWLLLQLFTMWSKLAFPPTGPVNRPAMNTPVSGSRPLTSCHANSGNSSISDIHPQALPDRKHSLARQWWSYLSSWWRSDNGTPLASYPPGSQTSSPTVTSIASPAQAICRAPKTNLQPTPELHEMPQPLPGENDRPPPTIRTPLTSVNSPPLFSLPELNLLDPPEEFPYEALAQKAQVSAATLERTFQEFGLNVRVVEIDTGPVITLFELELEAGLRLSKVTALADDLALALRVPSVRVVAPIPGKNTVGVEVPNELRVMVRLRELLEGGTADIQDKRLPLFLGKDVRGQPLVVDLARMPHLLIAGRTGTGKSVCLNALILSLLLTRTPQQVKLLMIDPKMVELSPYMRIPHLMHPVITDMKKAEAVLGWAVDKMEERYDLLARVGVRHLEAYNKLGKAKVLQRLGIQPDSEEAHNIPDFMPYIVIIADEMADMMMTSGKDVEGYIIRLAQKSRAVGIHLVLATQKPTVDVITGLIKSNLPARIAFQVSSRMDSRVVLDEMGAERLLGNGDLLYLAPGTSHLLRAQGTFVSDEEVNRIIEFYSDREPQYCEEIVRATQAARTAKSGASSEGRERDELYEQACEIIIREGRGSVSLLQRALGVGYGRGARMIDWMAEDGIVGQYNGSQAREVLMTIDQWEAMKAARNTSLS